MSTPLAVTTTALRSRPSRAEVDAEVTAARASGVVPPLDVRATVLSGLGLVAVLVVACVYLSSVTLLVVPAAIVVLLGAVGGFLLARRSRIRAAATRWCRMRRLAEENGWQYDHDVVDATMPGVVNRLGRNQRMLHRFRPSAGPVIEVGAHRFDTVASQQPFVINGYVIVHSPGSVPEQSSVARSRVAVSLDLHELPALMLSGVAGHGHVHLESVTDRVIAYVHGSFDFDDPAEWTGIGSIARAVQAASVL